MSYAANVQQCSLLSHFCFLCGWMTLVALFILFANFFYKALFKMAENFTIVLYIVLILLIALS